MFKNIKEILQAALRLIYKNRKFVYLLWGSNFLFSVVLTLPVYYLLEDQLLHSSMSRHLDYGFDVIWFMQFKSIYRASLGQIPYVLIGLAAIYILIQIFFLGGMISVFNNTKKNHYVDFFFGGVKYWYRFTKVLIISLVFYAAAFLINDLLGSLLIYAFSNQEKIIIEFILRASRYSLLIFLIGITSLTGDYVKVALAIRDVDSVTAVIIPVIRLLKTHFYRVFISFFIVSLLGALGAAVYNIIDNMLPKSHYIYFILAFILQQMLIIFRLFVRMLFTSTEVILYNDIQAPVITAEAEEVNQEI